MAKTRQHTIFGAAALAFALGACAASEPEPIEMTTSELNGGIDWGTFPGACADPTTMTNFKNSMTTAMAQVSSWVLPADAAHKDKLLNCLIDGILSGEDYNPTPGTLGHEDLTNPETILARMALNNRTRIGCQDQGGQSCGSAGFVNGDEQFACTPAATADPNFITGAAGHEIAHRFWDHPFNEGNPNNLEQGLSVNDQVGHCIYSLWKGNSPGVPNGTTRSAFVGEATLAQVGLEAGTPALPTYCPGNQFITGIWGNADSHVNRLGGICKPLDGTEATNLASVGTATGAAFNDSCPSGQIAVGAWGRTVAVADNLGNLPTTPIDAIGSVCDTVANVKAGGTTARTDDTIHGGTGGSAWRRLCPPKQALKGLRLRGGPYVNRVELVCQDVTSPSPMRQTQLSQVGGYGAFKYFENCQTQSVVTGLAIKVGSANNIVRLGASCQGVVAQAGDPAAFDLSSLSSQQHAMPSHGSFFPTDPSNDFFDRYTDATFAVVGLTIYTQSTGVSGIQPLYASVPGWSSGSNSQTTNGTLRGGTTGTMYQLGCPFREFLVGWLLNEDKGPNGDVTSEAVILAVKPVCRRFGPSAGGNPRGFTETGGNDVIVFRSPGSHVMGLFSRAPSAATDITLWGHASVNALGDPWGYARSDGVNAVVYRGSDNDIHELSWGQSSSDGDLSALSGGSAAQGNPMGYVRSDGRNTVIYRGTDNRLHELGLGGNGWEHNDLTAYTGLHSYLAGDPMGYVRTDGITVVVYRASDGNIHELGMNGGSPAWVDNDLFPPSGESVHAAGDPWGYRRDAGRNAVVYVGTDGKLHELLLTPGNNPPWTHGTLPSLQPTGTPSGYIRWDGKPAVVYRSTTTPSTVREVVGTTASPITWTDASLDAVDHPYAGPSGSPMGRRASNNEDSVVYLGTDSGVYEQRLGLTGTWHFSTY